MILIMIIETQYIILWPVQRVCESKKIPNHSSRGNKQSKSEERDHTQVRTVTQVATSSSMSIKAKKERGCNSSFLLVIVVLVVGSVVLLDASLLQRFDNH